MPLSDHEQRILEEIERRLAEDDPAFVEQVGRTDLYTHLARRIRLASIALCLGLVLTLVVFIWSLPLAAAGFLITVVSAVLLYRYVGQLGLARADRVAVPTFVNAASRVNASTDTRH
jgi:Flp pilus assembly protein TadB